MSCKLTKRNRYGPKARCAGGTRSAVLAALVAGAGFLTQAAAAPESATNTFPSVAEVIGGQTFGTFAERDIFFLRAIHDRYPDHWGDLLAANITLGDYTVAPDKLRRFIDQLGEAMRERNDPAACTNLAPIVTDAAFYANGAVYHPEILQAAARALIKLGPGGSKILAGAFSQEHYRIDPASLEDLADALGAERSPDPEFAVALAATAFDFSTTNGASYPRCTATAVTDLLRLPGGADAARDRLTLKRALDDPGRFQAVVEGVAAAQASELATNLTAVLMGVRSRLADTNLLAGGYKDDLQELSARIDGTLAGFAGKKAAGH